GTSDGAFEFSGGKILDGDTRAFAALGDKIYAAVYGVGIIDITTANHPVVFSNESVTSTLTRKDQIVIGTAGNGLYSYDGRQIQLEAGPETLRSGTIWCMAPERWGNAIWVGGQHGVFRLNDGKVEQIIKADDVRYVFNDNDLVWAATTTRGLLHA